MSIESSKRLPMPPEGPTYPYVGVATNTNGDDTTVLFTDRQCGWCLNSHHSDIGEFADDWAEYNFKPIPYTVNFGVN